MGLKARKKPVRDGHRRKWVVAQYDFAHDRVYAGHWTDDDEEARTMAAACGPVFADVMMYRADFEWLETKGRAVDLCAPGRGEVPRRD